MLKWAKVPFIWHTQGLDDFILLTIPDQDITEIYLGRRRSKTVFRGLTGFGSLFHFVTLVGHNLRPLQFGSAHRIRDRLLHTAAFAATVPGHAVGTVAAKAILA